MKVCLLHWQQCRDAIQARGLWHLVSTSGEEATAKLEAQLEGDKRPVQRDPLMDLNFMLMSNAIEKVGLMAIGPSGEEANDGEFCPLCLPRRSFDVHNTPTGRCGDPACQLQVKPGEKPWDEMVLESAADHLLTQYRQMGLVSTN